MNSSFFSPSDRPDPRVVTAWADRLRAMTGRIDSIFLPLEPVFLSTGERLRELHGSVSHLADSAEQAGALFSSTEIDDMLAGLAQAAGHIDVMRRQKGGVVEILDRMIQRADVMLRSLNTLRGILSQVQVLAVNAKIEASQLINTGTDFTVFTREITRLAKGGEQTVEGVRHELSSLRAATVKARAVQQAFEKTDLPELDAVASGLAMSVQGMRESQKRAAQGARDIPERLRALFGHLSQLVSDLQIFDTTRQRLEHIEEALTLAADMVEANDSSGMDGLQLRVFVNGIADLQSLQLVHACEHYHEAVARVGQSLTAMAAGGTEVSTLCEQAFGGGGAGSLLDIDSHLEKAKAVFTTFSITREQAASSLGHVVQAGARAGELMRSLNAVNGDMRLMGLNAAIKCGNMGVMGRVLSVIAQQLQAYANLTGGHVEEVASNLGKISQAARELAAGDGAESGQVNVEDVKIGLEQVELQLRMAGSGISQLLESIGTLGGSLFSLTRVVEQGFSGKADCRKALEDGVRELKSLAADCDSGLSGTALEEARREVLAFTESHYTMASERLVHGKAIDGSQAVRMLTGADTHDDAGGKEPDIDGLLF